MTSFETLKYYIRLIGLLENEPPNIKSTFFRRIFAFTTLTLYMMSSIWFLIFEAKTAEETFLSILAITGNSMGLFNYCIFLRYNFKVIQLFDDVDDIIEKRKRRAIIE